MKSHVVAAIGTLGVLWAVLPVRLPNPATGPANAECLTLPDTPPDLSRADRVPVFEHCSALNPTDVELLADLGLYYEAEGRLGDAESVYVRALDLDPLYADLRVRLGRLMLRRHDLPAARRQAEAALAVQPNRRVVLDLLRDAASPERRP